jgi:hypothetical protein
MTKKKLIGYWNDEENIYPYYPLPQNLEKYVVGNAFDSAVEKIICDFLKSGDETNFYRGSSKCRICRKPLGSHERTIGDWIWPDGLDHYVSEHKIILPFEFLSIIPDIDITKQNYNTISQTSIDDSFWKEWSKPFIKPFVIPKLDCDTCEYSRVRYGCKIGGCIIKERYKI